MKPAAFAILLLLPLASCSLTNSDAPPGHVGLVGCSMTMDIARGYAAAGGDRLWLEEDIPTYGGGDPEAWSKDGGDRRWPDFDAAMTRYPDTAEVWWQPCPSWRTTVESVPYEMMLAILAEIERRAPVPQFRSCGTRRVSDPPAAASASAPAAPGPLR